MTDIAPCWFALVLYRQTTSVVSPFRRLGGVAVGLIIFTITYQMAYPQPANGDTRQPNLHVKVQRDGVKIPNTYLAKHARVFIHLSSTVTIDIEADDFGSGIKSIVRSGTFNKFISDGIGQTSTPDYAPIEFPPPYRKRQKYTISVKPDQGLGDYTQAVSVIDSQGNKSRIVSIFLKCVDDSVPLNSKPLLPVVNKKDLPINKHHPEKQPKADN